MSKTGNIIITHHSAASYWLHSDLSENYLFADEQNPLLACSRNSRDLQRFDIGFPGFGAHPIHLMVNDKRLIRASRTIVTHVNTAELPKGSFVKLRDGLYVVSPELCLVQMARYLSDAQLVELAMNLCASYYIHPFTEKIERRKYQVAKPASLADYANKSSLRGSLKVANCMPLVLSGSRSPVETKLSILLRKVTSRGGEGFPVHALNHYVSADDRVNVAEQDDFYIDIAYTKQHVGIEYYGEEFHKDSAKDRRRLNALRAMGWNILTLEKQQLYNADFFGVFSNQLSVCLGVKASRPWDWEVKNRQLRFELGLI